jgi:NCS1 family nucleobase:cation symporter-1
MEREINGIHEWTGELSGPLVSKDMAPVRLADRKWNKWDIAALWVGMAVCIPTYMLASSLIAGGMNWWQAILTISLGNVIVLIPMVLNAHAGTKYGIPFPVFARASFGLQGTHLPCLLRAIVGCGWFGIQTWIGGAATHQILSAVFEGWRNLPVLDLGVLGSQPVGAWLGFLIFWVVNLAIVIRGIESIRWMEKIAAPFLLLIGLALLVWAVVRAKGFGPMLGKPSTFQTTADFWRYFFPALTGMVGYWATLSLNIPDFTRYARSQKDQMLGQALGLNTTMPFYSFIGVAVTSATVVIFGREIWDPVQLLAEFKSPVLVIVSMAALWIATLTTNLAANVVAPANSISNLWPRGISFRLGAVITCVVGVAIMPWKLLATPGGYIFTWLVGYSGLLGPIAGILIADYYLIRRTRLDLGALYGVGDQYRYRGGFNPAAMIALFVAILVNLPGFLSEIKVLDAASCELVAMAHRLYNYAWFVGFLVAFVLYLFLHRECKNAGNSAGS